MFTQKDVAEYYNTTMIHYKQWWNLDDNLSLHYGIWEEGIKNFSESLINTNRVMMELANVQSGASVMDAGCGVGGAAMYLAQEKGARVEGITLSEKQVAYANQRASDKGLSDKVRFQIMDYTKTNFEDGQFDVVWACESVSSAPDKSLFIKEAFRVLKKGGRLILNDYFRTNESQNDPNHWMKKWGDTWGITDFPSTEYFVEELRNTGFSDIKIHDYTKQIIPSAKRMYYSSLLGAIPSELYNLTHPNVSRFAKTHYKSGYYQYKTLKAGFWRYKIFLAVK